MKNWLIILIIFIVPLGLYGFLDFQTSGQARAKNEAVQKTSSNPLTLYKFYSALCKDCQKQTKELECLKEEFKGKVNFKDINVSGAPGESKEVQDLISKHNIQMVPTIVIINSNGKRLKKYDTVVKCEELKKTLNGLIQSEGK